MSLGRELDVALFMADHADPQVGLAAARAEWRSRKGVPAADALGWTLHQAGQSRAGLRYARLATRLGTPDALFWIHRGRIEAALGLERQHAGTSATRCASTPASRPGRGSRPNGPSVQ